MDRRGIISGAAAVALLAGAGVPRRTAAAARQPTTPDDLRTAARDAWIYGLPLVEAARLRAAAIGDTPVEGKAGFNNFLHQRSPADPTSRDVSAPEPDVLCSSAWIHLGGGPARISVPPTGGRYFSLAVFDLYGNVLGLVEGREASKGGHQITVIGPPPRVGVAGYTAPAPRMPPLHKMIHARSPWVWVLARTHLEGVQDLAAAHALQDGLELRVKSAKPPPLPAPVARDGPWSDYLYAVQELINQNPPPQEDVNFFRRIAPVQVGIDGGFEKARFADVELAEIAKGAAEAMVLAGQPPDDADTAGWIYPKEDLGDFGQDFLYRARVALTEPGAVRPQAVTCLRAAGPGGGRNFSGVGRHRVVLPPPPADGFWSLTLYEPQPDGRLFLAENPIDRYSVSGWTPGLRHRADGAVEVIVSRARPEQGETWLPAPANGPFALILRAYAPGDAILTRNYRPPPVEAL